MAIPKSLAALLIAVLSLLGTLTSTPEPVPDEGMWPFHDLPLEVLKKKYGFEPSKEWLENLQLASLKISSGGSGSFVSGEGLIATNHHVALEFINKLSTKERDLVENGFLARTREEELRCEGATVQQLISFEDVTEKILEGTDELAPAEASRTIDQRIARIQEEESRSSGLMCQVVTMHGGARYWVYRYKVYDDIRLVFAPEKQIAYFGGDRDNFCYPRYCLDCSLLRAYENGKPARTPHHLRFSPTGVSEGDLIFISGNPASTGRYETVTQLEFKRDVLYPSILRLIRDREQALDTYASLGEEERLAVLDEIFSLRNSDKAYTGMLGALRDQGIMGRIKAREVAFKEEIRKKIAAGEEDPSALEAFQAIAEAQEVMKKNFRDLRFQRLDGTLWRLANQVVRLVLTADSSNAETVKQRIAALTGTTFDENLEVRRLEAALATSRAVLGEDHPFVKAALGDETAEAAARRIVEKQRLTGEEFLRGLIGKGRAGLEETDESLLRLAVMSQKTRSALGPAYGQAQSTTQRALTRIARARFKVYGDAIYPDATFTLRLSFGVVKGYELGTTDVPWKTNVLGLYARNSSFDDVFPYNLPPRWLKARSKLDPDTPVDFVSTADTTGGNSGSPVVDRAGNLVGLLFDGNIQSLRVDNLYDETVSRSVCVDSRFIAHALDVVYQAEHLLKELGLK